MRGVGLPEDKQGTEEKEEKKDLFHHGIITKLFPSNNMGLVRTESGREVPFSFELVLLSGEAKKPSDLKEGQEVGYDMGWTSKGLRITKIRVYSKPSSAEGISSLEGQGGQSENLPSQDLSHKDP
jgi:hypothetical protein